MLLAYDVPWWGWPITAAGIGVCGAILVAWLAFVFNRHLKLLDATRTIGEKLESFKEAVTLACLPKFGEKLGTIGGWGGFATRLSELKAAVEILEIYGDERVTETGRKLHRSAIELRGRVFAASVHGKHLWETKDNLSDDMKFLTDETKTSEIDKYWSELLRLVRKNLHHNLMNATD